MAQTFQISGLKEIEEALNNLPTELQQKVLGQINKKAVDKLVVGPIRGAVSYSSKTESNIKVTPDTEDKTAFYGGVTSDAFWLRFTDFGTKQRFTKIGRPKGRIVGRRTIETTIIHSVDDIITFANEEIGDELEKILNAKLKSTLKKL